MSDRSSRIQAEKPRGRGLPAPRPPRAAISSLLVALPITLLVFGQAALGAVAVDTTTSAGVRMTTGTTTLTFAHTTAGTNRLLVVGVSINRTNNNAVTVSGVTYNGVALTSVGNHNDAGNTRRVEMWRLIAPPTGTFNVVVTCAGVNGNNTGVVAGATTFTGVDQTTPLGTFASADGANTASPLVNVSSSIGDLVLDTLAAGGDRTVTSFGAGQTSRWNALSNGAASANTDVRGTGSTEAGGGLIPMSETLSGTSNWSICGVAVKAAGADLSIGKSGAPGTVGIGANVTYTLTVTNNGSGPASNVVVNDPLPAGMTFVSSTPSQGTCAGTTTVTCNLGAIASGATATVTIVATNATSAPKRNTATVSNAGEPDPSSSNNSATATTLVTPATAPICVQPGKDGAGGTLAGVVNTYYAGTASPAAGATSLTVGTPGGDTTKTVAANDLLLVIQMQDAAINSNNSDSYGSGVAGLPGSGSTNLNNTGRFEFVRAASALALGAGGTITIAGGGAGGGLVNAYTNAAATGTQGQRRFQVIRVPQYTTASLGSATAPAWTTTTGGTVGLGTGGVLAIDVAGALDITGTTANVNGKGFRGGAGRQLTGGGGANTDFRTASTVNNNGGKGEGIAGTPEWVADATGVPATTSQPNDGYPNGSHARGAPGNAGGGGTDGNPAANDQNSGGGGGANGGAGALGGNSWNSNLPVGGFGGAAFSASVSQVVMGGGGGAGSRNNDPTKPQASSGAPGGGIIIIRAGQVTGTGTIGADGAAAYNLTDNDAGGGGGAGGSVLVVTVNGNLSGLTVNARGGRGGNSWVTQAPGGYPGERHGPGGGGGGGVVLTSSPAAAVDVSGGLSGATTSALDGYGTEPGGPGGVQSNAVLPTDVPGAGSGADCSPDPAIAKTHTGNFPSNGTGTFNIVVTNVAPYQPTANPGTITVTDTLTSGPPALTPTGASGTGWTCGIVSQTVTCSRTDSVAAGASYPPIVVTVSVAGVGPATLTNTASLTATGTNADYYTANDSATDTVAILSPTLARLRSCRAVRTGGAVHLLWGTGFEVSNLGFRIHREEDGLREEITPSLVAGSALFAGERTQLSGGREYRWIDRKPESDGSVRYWLEDVDLDGRSTWHGPFYPEERGRDRAGEVAYAAPRTGLSTLLEDLGRPAPEAGQMAAAPGMGDERRALLLAPTVGSQTTQWDLAAQPAAKISITREGWYRVTRRSLAAGGFDPGSDSKKLQLIAEGKEQAIRVNDGGDNRFDLDDSIEFYGTGLDTASSGTRIYWLVAGKQPGMRIETAPRLEHPGAAPSGFTYTVERKDRTIYFAALTSNGDAPNFFGPVVSATPVALSLGLPHVDRAAAFGPKLRVALQGATAGVSHVVDVRVNGHFAGTIGFFGQAHVEQIFGLQNPWLLEGSNTVTLTARGSGQDVSLLDSLRLSYTHQYAADQDALKFSLSEEARTTITGFTDPGVRAVDITNPEAVREMPVEVVRNPAGGFSAVVTGTRGSDAVFMAFAPSRVLAPAGIAANVPSTWNDKKNEADLVILAHPSLMQAAAPLQALRERQGLATALVDITDAFDEFSFGEKDPQAIRDFLVRAKSWRKAPRYVLLLGDATFDPRNYLGFGDFDLVSTKLIPTTYLKTASDDWFVDFDDDSLPDLAVGRLPLRTAEEASAVIGRIVGRDQESRTGGWGTSVLLVADKNDGFDFEAAVSAQGSLVPRTFTVERVLAGQTDPGAARDAILGGINGGKLLVSFTGHGSQAVWGKQRIFDSADATALTNGGKLPVVLAMTCLNGLFHDVYGDSLAEAFLKAPKGGAVAVWASSALTDPGPQEEMNQRLFQLLFGDPGQRIGDAARNAKKATQDRDVRRTWILFGDPAMTLR